MLVFPLRPIWVVMFICAAAESSTNAACNCAGNLLPLLCAPGLCGCIAHKICKALWQFPTTWVALCTEQRAQNLDQRPVSDTLAISRTAPCQHPGPGQPSMR